MNVLVSIRIFLNKFSLLPFWIKIRIPAFGNLFGCRIVRRKIGYLYVGGHDPPFASTKVTKDIKDLDGKIIECKFENNSWVFMRERTDKSFPNSFNTAMGMPSSHCYS